MGCGPINPGHNATAGLGGASWQNRCGAWRAPVLNFFPATINEGAGKICGADGIALVCTPGAPAGIVQAPFSETLAVGASFRQLSLPLRGVLVAFELTQVLDAAGVTAFDDLLITDWESANERQSYPGFNNTAATSWADPNTAPVPAREYVQANLLNGFNRLPTWVQAINLNNGQDFMRTHFLNGNAGALTILGFLHIAYSVG